MASQLIPAVLNKDLEEKVLNAFGEKLPSRPVPLHYRLGLLLTTVAMVILPLIYISIIGLSCWWLYYHAIGESFLSQEVSRSSSSGRRSGKGEAFAYLAPLVVGGVLVVFMIKPLFARAPKRREPLKVSR